MSFLILIWEQPGIPSLEGSSRSTPSSLLLQPLLELSQARKAQLLTGHLSHCLVLPHLEVLIGLSWYQGPETP